MLARFVTLLFWSSVYVAAALPIAADDEKPNIVLIMADDMGYGDLSCYGGWIKTPHLDKLAAEGLRFTDFHSSGAVCSPTRAGLVTGRYQQRAGIPGVVFADRKRPVHYHGLQASEITFAEQFKAAGYATAIFGKWHLGYYEKYNPVNHGFDQFVGYVSGNVDFFSHVDQAGKYDWWHNTKKVEEPGYTTHLITKHAVEFIEKNKGRPFCLYLPHEAPHYPFQGPNDKAERTVGGKFKTQGAVSDTRRAYREMVQEMDKGIGEVVAAIHKHKIHRKTLVFFLSDNGAARWGSNKPLNGGKGSVWEGGHRVPAIAWWPGMFEPGSVCKELTISIDLMPTMLSAAGVDVPTELKLDGVDLMPVMTAGRPLDDRKLYWNGVAMREGPWKLITKSRGLKGGPALFNLVDDLGEKNNLARQHPERVKKMLENLEAWKKDVAAGTTVQPDIAHSDSGE
jgi:arylsulfatase A-like enzyme